MICEYCEHDDDNVRGIYICPHCGSKEMVDKANEPNAYDDLLRRLYEAKCEVETSILETDLSYRKGLLHTLTIFRKHFPELEDK